MHRLLLLLLVVEALAKVTFLLDGGDANWTGLRRRIPKNLLRLLSHLLRVIPVIGPRRSLHQKRTRSSVGTTRLLLVTLATET